MAIQQKPRTLEEFRDFALLPENAHLNFEFINGAIVEMSPNRTFVSEIRDRLSHKVWSFCENANIPVHTSGEAGAYRILDYVLVPDFAYKPTPMSKDYPDPTPPLWAVEVISPTDSASDIRNKRGIYRDAGILVWEIYPDSQAVDVYAPGQAPRSVGSDGILDGGDVLPGFSLAVNDLFPKE